MGEKRKPRGFKNEREYCTLNVPKELYNQVHELAIGSEVSLMAMTCFLLKKGLERVPIVEETIVQKRLDIDIKKM